MLIIRYLALIWFTFHISYINNSQETFASTDIRLKQARRSKQKGQFAVEPPVTKIPGLSKSASPSLCRKQVLTLIIIY